MLEFASSTDVTLTIPHVGNGGSIDVTGLKYEVRNADGDLLVALTTAIGFNPASTSTNIIIPKTINTITTKMDIRQVDVYLETGGGTFKQSIFYKILGDLIKLTPMVDSFMTFPQAILLRMKTSENLMYYDALPDELKCVALENAYKALVKVKYVDPRYLNKSYDDYGYYNQNQITDYDIGGYSGIRFQIKGIDISGYNQSQFNALPQDMRDAITKAQLIEANYLVENSPIREKIRLGVISETIGESSMFFKQNGPTGSKFPGVSDEAYIYLKEYLWKNATSSQSMRIGRA